MKIYPYKNSKALFVIALLVFIFSSGYSQENKHSFSIVAGGFKSYLDYTAKEGYLKEGEGGSLGLRYSYYLNQNWSIGFGVEYQSYNSSFGYKRLSESYITTDSEGESFEFRYNAKSLKETQKFRYFNIPVTIQYESSATTGFYAIAGAKAGFALSATYQTSITDLTTSGYYAQYNAELFGPRFMGFAHFGNVESGEKDLNVKMSYSATFEAGLKQITGAKSTVYIGLYLDYGLNNAYRKKGKDVMLVEYPEGVPVSLQYNSALNTSYVDEVRLISYGVKLRFAIR